MTFLDDRDPRTGWTLGATLAAAGFVGCVVAANAATSHWGLIPVGFGLVATAGTYFAGLTFVLRDVLSDRFPRWVVLVLITVAALLSYVLADPRIALASGVAFLVSEVADLAVYEPLRRRGWVRAAIASNFVGSVVDTVLFLAIAGFPIWSSVPGQLVAKMTVTAVAVGLVLIYRRAVSRDPQRA